MATAQMPAALQVDKSFTYLEPTLSSSTCSTSITPNSLSTPSNKRKRSHFSSSTSLSSSSPSTEEMALSMMGPIPSKISFNPKKHLAYSPPKKIWTMKEIGLENAGVSPNAVSEPFPLFTEEAVKQMRAEIFSKPVLENNMYSSNLSACQIRGFASEHAPFIYDTWKNPEVLKIVSDIAGIELVPEMDFELAHVNVSINNEEDQKKQQAALAEHRARQTDEGVSGCGIEDDSPSVDWHTDSYPFVCVVMLSDCTNMIGGETALHTGTGEVMKVRGPTMGHAVIMQGRYIEHQALRAIGGTERITTVASFRPKSAMVKDDTVLTTVRAISDLQELYCQYTEYRLEMLEERVRDQLRRVRERKRANRKFDIIGAKTFCHEQKQFLESMLVQMVDEDKVIPGYTDDSHLFSKGLIAASKMKAAKDVNGGADKETVHQVRK